MKNPEVFEDLCGLLEKSVASSVEELKRDNKDRISVQDAEYLNNLMHSVKSVTTVLAMEGYGSSERRGRNSMGRYTSRNGGSYDDGMSSWGYSMRAYDDGNYDGRSYDGSYRSYEGRSMHGDREKLERLARETDDPNVKRALQEAMRNI